MGLTLYRSRPQTVWAVRWTGSNWTELSSSLPANVRLDDGELQLLAGVNGAQDWVPVPVGHWIACNADHSDMWPIDNDYFTTKYRET